MLRQKLGSLSNDLLAAMINFTVNIRPSLQVLAELHLRVLKRSLQHVCCQFSRHLIGLAVSLELECAEQEADVQELVLLLVQLQVLVAARIAHLYL